MTPTTSRPPVRITDQRTCRILHADYDDIRDGQAESADAVNHAEYFPEGGQQDADNKKVLQRKHGAIGCLRQSCPEHSQDILSADTLITGGVDICLSAEIDDAAYAPNYICDGCSVARTGNAQVKDAHEKQIQNQIDQPFPYGQRRQDLRLSEDLKLKHAYG